MNARLRARGVAAALALGLLVAGCSADTTASTAPEPAPTASEAAEDEPEADSHAGHGSGKAQVAPARSTPLRSGERFHTLKMPAAYNPSAPTGVGNDDYRCFVLDPSLDEDVFLTGVDVLPGTADVVHHVILFRVPPDQVAAAEAKDADEPGQGWTCFGGTGLDEGNQLDDAQWLGAWAPGGGERVMARDVGVPLEAGSRVVMQVHYNLLADARPDVTAAKLRMAPGTRDLAALETMLLPAPVELPCRPENADGPLCDREAARKDADRRFGAAAVTADALHLLCGTDPPGPVQNCERTIEEPATIRAAAGHMHLLGRSIQVTVNPGTPEERTVLDIPVWDFDDQGSREVRPVALETGDTVKVTCRHDQALRDVLPAFEGQEERYVVWGDGTTDEMCLGMLLITRP